MLHQLLVYNKADCYPLIKVLGKTKQLHYKHSTFKYQWCSNKLCFDQNFRAEYDQMQISFSRLCLQM